MRNGEDTQCGSERMPRLAGPRWSPEFRVSPQLGKCAIIPTLVHVTVTDSERPMPPMRLPTAGVTTTRRPVGTRAVLAQSPMARI